MLRIGSAEGFYGDDVTRAMPMIEGGHVDVVCFEALSELTLAILRRDQMRDPTRGYTRDIEVIAEQILPLAYARKIPLITNGGGLNPAGAARKVMEAAKRLGLSGLKVATVTGDDLLPRLNDLLAAGEPLANIETGELLSLAGPPIVTANAYLGAFPLAEALRQGADIVITGRVADPCLYLAPLLHRFGWTADDWNRLACGIICGHLLECTGQVVGGNSLALLNEMSPEALAHPGYPIAEVEEDGSFVVAKTPGTAGRVSIETVKEQLLYEMHDPAAYITPDVVADVTTLHLVGDGPDRVRVTGVTGHPRTDTLKVNIARMEGYSRELIFLLGWPAVWRKEEQLRGMLAEAWRGLPITRVEYTHPGLDSLYGTLEPPPLDPLELAVRVMFTADDQQTLKSAVRRAMALGLSGPAGMAVSGTSVGADPRFLLGLWPALVRRELVEPGIAIELQAVE
ncbi:MAG TPA: acyclic terpene utilization AtuA family protein [Ktedonobacterales bacterium]|nr:acyclic terpene utilization AtuA family protein [Ktedonobacterales bacterium]